MSAVKLASILRLKHLQESLNPSRSWIYTNIAAGKFPPPIILGARAVGWLESDVVAWMDRCVKSSENCNLEVSR